MEPFPRIMQGARFQEVVTLLGAFATLSDRIDTYEPPILSLVISARRRKEALNGFNDLLVKHVML